MTRIIAAILLLAGVVRAADTNTYRGIVLAPGSTIPIVSSAVQTGQINKLVVNSADYRGDLILTGAVGLVTASGDTITITEQNTGISAANLAAGTVATAIDGSAITNLNASNLASGTVPDARIDSAITRDAEAAAAYQPTNANLSTLALNDGGSLTNLNAANLAAGGVLPSLDGGALTNLSAGGGGDVITTNQNIMVMATNLATYKGHPGSFIMRTTPDGSLKGGAVITMGDPTLDVSVNNSAAGAISYFSENSEKTIGIGGHAIDTTGGNLTSYVELPNRDRQSANIRVGTYNTLPYFALNIVPVTTATTNTPTTAKRALWWYQDTFVVNGDEQDYDFQVRGASDPDSLIHADGALRRVGINDSTPSYALDVLGDAQVQSNLHVSGTIYLGTNAYLKVDATTTNLLFITISPAVTNSVGLTPL